jgi:hypothetical protein
MSRKKRRKKAQSWDYGWWEELRPSREEVLHRVEPLVSQIRRVDAVVDKIARGKARVAELVDLEQILREPISMAGSGQPPVSLSQPVGVRSALSSIARELHLEVQAVEGQYPCYLLCRISDSWDSPDTVLEELHLSTVRNELFVDRRFLVLMRNGRSRTFLRMSSFRTALRRHTAETGGEAADDEACDDILEAVARLVLDAAWYEDQRLPFAVADVFQLGSLRSALEVVGFILGSDLYHVAAYLQDDEDITGFVEHVHKNRPLASLLRQLQHRGAENLTNLETEARQAFIKLNQAFSAFMSEREILRDLEHLELYKIVLGSFGNLREIAHRKHWTERTADAVQVVEACSQACLDRLSLDGVE